ncbi:post-GPI attachment to proteins factor 3-like isoform X2 [Biomphalaria glabrata]|nr:post-GPI attachment to proteins factor 3-like isoform X2 [Biomphalaria glabrata]KAI8793238.1 post-GPI attachment to proteins factor 3 isoform X2 [Biomphalaria glabrata]
MKDILWNFNYPLLSCISALGLVTFVHASNGDRSYVFGKCIQSCLTKNCTDETEFSSTQPLYMNLLHWTCLDECRYHCMWTTVDAFQRDGSQVPQFFGKWPFVRYLGIQEPASMVFSLLNCLSHISILYYRSLVPASSPMFYVWHGNAVVGFFTWLCATAFHTRDTPLTEKMDYFSAFGLVIYNIVSLFCRVIGPERKSTLSFIAAGLFGLYAYHIYYLAFVHFDYGYNMKMNIGVGAVNGIGWILWSLYHWKSRPYVWKCICVIIGLNLLVALELGDFPPFFWTFDAHAIWHAGTVPLNLLWYSFIIDDALYKPPKLDDNEVKKMV